MNIIPVKIETLCAMQGYLGEGPIWLERSGTIAWLDIMHGIVMTHRWSDGKQQRHVFDDAVGMVQPTAAGGLILGIGTRIVRFDPATGKQETIVDLEPGKSDHRCNDAIVDAQGRLWVGTTHRQHLHEAGALYRVEAGGRVTQILDKLTITNGMAFSPDGTTLYHIDSPTHRVHAHRFHEVEGTIDHKKVAIKIPHELGGPDGMARDAEGMLWVAHWGGHGVYRWDPVTGGMMAKLPVPAPHVTSCAFVGPDLDHLVITTARKEMSEAALKDYPQSGDVFIGKMPVRGTLPNLCDLRGG